MAELQDRPLTIAGQTYTLRWSIRAMLALKERWGLKTDAEVEKRMKTADLNDFITILWAGTRTHHPELTEDMVLGWMDDGGVEGIEAIQGAIEAATPPGRPPEGQRKTPHPR